jgi:SH3-like domain-containing protein
MAKYASEVVNQAKKWLGKKEGDGSHKEIIDIYNSHKPLARGYKVKYTDSWCSTFVSAVAIELGYTDIIPTECGCEKHIELFKKINEWVENENRTPNIGDIIFYDWEDNGIGDNTGRANHVGIVEKVSNGVITVIEGNIDNSVGRRKIKVNARYIRGYGVPKYDKEETIAAETKYVYNCDSLNVRSGAGVSYKIVDVLKKGTKVEVYETKNGWERIGTGKWVSGNYLTSKKPSSYPTKKVNAKNGLNVRNKPSVLGKKLSVLKHGTSVTIYKTSGNWSKISSNSEKWVSSKYLK